MAAARWLLLLVAAAAAAAGARGEARLVPLSDPVLHCETRALAVSLFRLGARVASPDAPPLTLLSATVSLLDAPPPLDELAAFSLLDCGSELRRLSALRAGGGAQLLVDRDLSASERDAVAHFADFRELSFEPTVVSLAARLPQPGRNCTLVLRGADAARALSVPLQPASPHPRAIDLFLVEGSEGAATRAGREVDEALLGRLCARGVASGDDTLALIDESERAEIVGAVLKPVMSTIVDPVMKQMQSTVTPTVEDKVQQHVGRPVAADSPDTISSHVCKAVIANVTNLLTDSVTHYTLEKLSERLGNSIAPYVAQALVEETAKPIADVVIKRLEEIVPPRLQVDISNSLARSVPYKLVQELTKTISAAVVPTVILGIKATLPSSWEFPTCRDTQCAAESDGVARHFAAQFAKYYSHYYAEYYAEYYGEAVARVNEQIG